MDHMPLIDVSGVVDVKPSPRRRPLLSRFARALHRAWLRHCINSTERYLAACARDGILVGHVVDEWRWEIHDMRLRLDELERK